MLLLWLPLRPQHLSFSSYRTVLQPPPRRVIGGHIVAVLIGGLLTIILHSSFLNPIVAGNRIVFDVMAALSLGISILLMVVTNTEHPPAAGTALGLILEGFRLEPGFL